MTDLLFVIRMVIITVVIVLLMQIKIGPATIEQHSTEWLHSSSAVASLQGVSEGAVKVLTQTYKAVVTSLDTNIGKVFRKDEMPGTRAAAFGFQRSAEFMRNEEAKKKAAEAMEAAKEELSEAEAEVDVEEAPAPTK